ncbi:hypothetical protein MNBD_NITROSPINAE05-1099 [hydrothermal vent metagenome]|uniref:Uncharacterized protein n=1 Tax=hydrothermal vent metagenome TaxID=652676 RepID=A0A3B1DCF1_9ZZZZ
MNNDDDDWEDTFDENGITLGPEEILHREIQKSKNLKVERLQLKDEVEKLRAENIHLTQKIQALTEEAKAPLSSAQKDEAPLQPQPFSGLSPKWFLFLLIFNSSALAILLYFLFQK